MVPVRPVTDGGFARTERVPAAPSIDIGQLVRDAREHGLVWLRTHFLADPTAPDHLPTLLAVLRLDLSRSGSHSARLAEYRRVFPALRLTPEGRRATDDLEFQVAVRVVKTPRPSAAAPKLELHEPTQPAPDPVLIDQPGSVPRSAAGPRDVPELDPAVAGELGFGDLTRLGQGGFGTVYAARQTQVGNRLVAIKYTVARSREPQVLAALQHPNIMPVWSVHEHAGHRVFCMPLHGRTTLADVLRMIDRTKSLPATGAGFLSAASVTEVEAVTAVEPEVELPPDEAGYESDRRRMERLGYVESVVQGMTRLADALAHAHRRRVIHLDIKPANVLVTDDGGFMILDFGLAYQNGVAASPEAGGTVRYMAPEQLTSLVQGRGVRPDPRMDLYALGLVFFELLTGRHPFAESLAPGRKREEWVTARHRHPPRVRRFNPAVPPGVEAIVLKLLHPDRGQRYQSAEQLFTDLVRHQAHQPLLHAANPSWRERFSKFRRRHPVFSVAVMAGVLAVLAAAGFWVARREADRARANTEAVQRADAEATLAGLTDEQTAVRIDAGSQSPDTRRHAVERVEKWRAAYGVDAGGDWRARPGYARLTPEQQRAITAALGEQALLAAHAERLNALGRPADEATAALERAVGWNERAEAVFAPDVPAAVGEQRAELAKLLGRPAVDPPPLGDTPLDLYLRGLGRIADRDYAGAREALEALEKRETQHAAGQFALGYVYQTVGLYYPSLERYQVAKALARTDPRPAYNRGAVLVYYSMTKEAIADLTTALDRDPKLVDGYYLRANAYFMEGTKPKAAEPAKLFASGLADIDRAIELGGERYRFVALREALRAKVGDAAGAEHDRLALEGMTPQDDQDYVVRGNRRRAGSRPQEALADFLTATEMNPLSVSAWNCRAAQQSALKMTAEAADSLARLIELVPEHHGAKFERAVMLARLGKRDEAVKQLAGLTPADKHAWYQQAAVFAHSSDTHLDDAQAAVQALKMARQLGYDLKQLATDDDFDVLRDRVDLTPYITGKAKE